MTITSFNRWLDISHCCFPIKKIPPRWTNIAMDKYCKKSPSLIDTPVRRSPYSMGQVAKFHGADSQRLSISILYIPIGEIPLFEALEPTGTAVILPSGMDKPHWWTLIESPWGSRIRGFQEFLQPELNKKAATTYWKTYILDGFIHGYSCSLSLYIYVYWCFSQNFGFMWDLSHGFNNESIQQNAGFTPDASRFHWETWF